MQPPGGIEPERLCLKKLCKCAALICKKSPTISNMVRQQKMLDQILTSLDEGIRNMSTDHKPTIYTENVVLNILKLLGALIEGQEQNRQLLIQRGAQVYNTLNEIISQNQHIDLAGQCCLILSVLMRDSPKAQKLFENESMVERLVFLADFN